jgi:3-deoxy-D-manno-octulosonate 8-phosphate phosphatase (KDO 8-P phosphatase)
MNELSMNRTQKVQGISFKCRGANLAKIKLVALDVDGVLTNGIKYYDAAGLAGLSFNARDGLGIYLLLRAGIKVSLVTNGRSDIVKARAVDLGISELLEGVEDKGLAMRRLREKYAAKKIETLYVGDDLWDLAAFEQVGISVAVPEAPEPVLKAADWITKNRGGRGAVREVADAILAAKGIEQNSLLNSTPGGKVFSV